MCSRESAGCPALQSWSYVYACMFSVRATFPAFSHFVLRSQIDAASDATDGF